MIKRLKSLKNIHCIFPQVNNSFARLTCIGTGLFLFTAGTIGSAYYGFKGISYTADTIYEKTKALDNNTSLMSTKPKKYVDYTNSLRLYDKSLGIVYPVLGITMIRPLIYSKPLRELVSFGFDDIKNIMRLIRSSNQCCMIVRKTAELSFTLPLFLGFILIYPLCITMYCYPITDATNFGSQADPIKCSNSNKIGANWWINN